MTNLLLSAKAAGRALLCSFMIRIFSTASTSNVGCFFIPFPHGRSAFTHSFHLLYSFFKKRRYLNFKDFMKFPTFGLSDLQYSSTPPLLHKWIQPGRSILNTIREKDLLLHYPYQSFHHMIDLLREAAIDPKVTSIRMTLYRVAEMSKIVNALSHAVKNGKNVTVLFEFRARFDEEANIYWANQLIEEFNLSHEAVAAQVGKSRTAITNTLRLLNLSKTVQQALREEKISEGHARALLGLSRAQAQNAALQTVLKEELSVRQTEELVRRLSGERRRSRSPKKKSADLSDIEEKLRQALGTRVTLSSSSRGGRIIIHFYSDEELNALVERFLEGYQE